MAIVLHKFGHAVVRQLFVRHKSNTARMRASFIVEDLSKPLVLATRGAGFYLELDRPLICLPLFVPT